MPVRQSEWERGVVGLLVGLAFGALAGLLARSGDEKRGQGVRPWAGRSKS